MPESIRSARVRNRVLLGLLALAVLLGLAFRMAGDSRDATGGGREAASSRTHDRQPSTLTDPPRPRAETGEVLAVPDPASPEPGATTAVPGTRSPYRTEFSCRVADEQGNPIEGALLLLGEGYQRAFTDAAGLARLVVQKPFLSRERPLACSRRGFETGTISIGGGTPTEGVISFSLKKRLPTFVLRVRLVDSSGAPVPGLRLRVAELDPRDGGAADHETSTTDRDGELALAIYDPARTVTLDTVDEGWVTSEVPTYVLPEEARKQFPPIDVVVHAQTTIQPMVSTVDTGGTPARFFLLCPDWGVSWDDEKRTRALNFLGLPHLGESAGGLVVRRVPPGHYRVIASAGGTGLGEARISVGRAEGLRRVEVVATSAPPTLLTVLDGRGNPVEGAILSPFEMRLDDWMRMFNIHGRMADMLVPYMVDGSVAPDEVKALLGGLQRSGFGISTDSGEASLSLSASSTRRVWVFVPGRGVLVHDLSRGPRVVVPDAAPGEVYPEFEGPSPADHRLVLAWVENPFPDGRAFPEPVEMGFLSAAFPNGTGRFPLLPDGRYRVSAMRIDGEGRLKATGDSAPVEVRDGLATESVTLTCKE